MLTQSLRGRTIGSVEWRDHAKLEIIALNMTDGGRVDVPLADQLSSEGVAAIAAAGIWAKAPVKHEITAWAAVAGSAV